jgi:hypothetical protein
MTNILNFDLNYPKPYVVDSFKNGSFIKTLIHSGTPLYRIVSKEDPINNVRGNNFVSGEFWIDHDAFLNISSKVNYELPSKSITDLSRHSLGITSKFSMTADSIIGVTLLQDVYAWKGIAARQLESYKNGMKQLYHGGLTQFWIPNLNEKIVMYKFFHTI